MNAQNNMNEFLDRVTEDIAPEDIVLAGLQGTIAAEISMKRQNLGWSQKELAKKLGVTQGLVSRWERAETNFTLSTLVKLASVLGMELQSPIVPTKSINEPKPNNVFYFPEATLKLAVVKEN